MVVMSQASPRKDLEKWEFIYPAPLLTELVSLAEV